MLSRNEIKEALTRWNRAWDQHDLDGIMELFHEDILFENWTGAKVRGKQALHQAWKPWFENHRGFRFIGEDIFMDELEQKVLYQWVLEWPSNEKGYEGKPERRRGLMSFISATARSSAKTLTRRPPLRSRRKG